LRRDSTPSPWAPIRCSSLPPLRCFHTVGYGMTIRYRMGVRKLGKSSLMPADWARAAFRAIARGGVDAVAVEPIAAELGATKGSFYWHFKNRGALIEAALDEWEQRLTDDVIEELDRESDPARRLKNLFAAAFELGARERAAEIALLANPDPPSVRRRVRPGHRPPT